eukprot:TRINITY_DN29611_c0_g1_i1.p1 TRINITY_DN29611_c0_g1~~TRINITY_DN29611_c0_g1_i1.p1  ORF type:complete len:163 (-),score=40.72 TRINITY_DN29611_c0_g1_i1:82-570(-)
MPRVTLTNNYGHHCRAKIEMERIIYDQNNDAQETSGNVTLGLEIPPVPFNVGAGGSLARKEEHNNIVHLDLPDPNYTIIDAGKRIVMSYSSKRISFLTIEVNVDNEYIRKVNRQHLDEFQNTSLSFTAKGAVEDTMKREKILGIGRNLHKDHDPTHPKEMNK